MEEGATLEFSRLLRVDTIGSEEENRELQPKGDEAAALAVRLGLQKLSDFKASVSVFRSMTGEIVTRGRVVADVVQTCVMSLEPVPGHVEEDFEVRFTTFPAPEPRDLVIGPDDDEPPEPLTGESLDIGELATQQLALALDPWPRLPDAELPDDLKPDPARDGPFAALAGLREKQAHGGTGQDG